VHMHTDDALECHSNVLSNCKISRKKYLTVLTRNNSRNSRPAKKTKGFSISSLNNPKVPLCSFWLFWHFYIFGKMKVRAI